MENNEIFDTVLIGKNPSIYMSSIYIQTYNMKQLLIKDESPESLDFEGYDLVPGVLEVDSKQTLIDRLDNQLEHLGVGVVNDKVVSITFDSVFKIKCNKSTYLAKSVVVDTKKNILNEKGCFYSLENVQTKEAIDLLANGCKVSFAVREYVKTVQ